MPFGQFKDFDACIKHYTNKGKTTEQAKKICGAIKHKVEGEHQEKISEWVEDCLGHKSCTDQGDNHEEIIS